MTGILMLPVMVRKDGLGKVATWRDPDSLIASSPSDAT